MRNNPLTSEIPVPQHLLRLSGHNKKGAIKNNRTEEDVWPQNEDNVPNTLFNLSCIVSYVVDISPIMNYVHFHSLDMVSL